jgi:hypothetical protein
MGGLRIGRHPGFTPREPHTEEENYNQVYWNRRTGGTWEGAPGQNPGVGRVRWRYPPDGSDNQAPGDIDTGGGVVTGEQFTVERDRTAIYTIEIRDSADALITTIPDWLADGGELKLTLDEASTLRFAVDGNHASVPDLTPPNRVWIRDRWGYLIEIFSITKTRKRRIGDAIYYDTECMGLLDQLAREPVEGYNTGFTGITPNEKTVREIIEDLFASQDQSPPISIGDIDAAIANHSMPFRIHHTSVLDALRTIQTQMPRAIAGHFYIGPSGAFHWLVKFGVTGKTIEVGESLQGLSYDVDYSGQVTRLRMFGGGSSPRTRLSLIDAGEPETYIESKTGTYGIKTGMIVDNRIKYADSLLQIARRTLEEVADPVVTVNIDAINLAATDTAGHELVAEIYVGSTYTVIDPDNNISVEVTVRSVTHNLAHILDIKIALNNRNPSLADFFETLMEQIQEKFEIEDDGSRHPFLGRTFRDNEEESIAGLGYKNGDLRNIGTGQFRAQEYRQDGDWRRLMFVYEANTLEELPTDPALVERHSMGHVGATTWYYWNRPTEEWLPLVTELSTITRQAIVKTISDATLGCVFWDPLTETEGDAVTVAKPHNLQRAAFQGQSITYINGQTIEYDYTNQRKRTADDGEQDPGVQVMTSDYYIGEPIVILKVPTGFPGVDWMDINTGAKSWAREVA